ncbi:MAG: YfcE family phosphodiesterase [Oscillospiraceae bacterium]|nr:YfcE family phosphodiesterase [Oscillospiraceae bacterium]
MKIAVFSDSHGVSAGMIKAVENYAPEQIIHLGDGNRDLRALERAFPRIPVCAVSGNCDIDCTEAEYRVISLNGVRCFVTHGHRYGVRYGNLYTLLYAAELSDCRIVMYGHTHRAVFDNAEGMTVINPGSVGSGADRSWAKLEIGSKGEISCEICPV